MERKRRERSKGQRLQPQQGENLLPKPDLVSGPAVSQLHFISWLWIPLGLTTILSLTQSTYASLSEFLFLVNNSSDRLLVCPNKKPSLLNTAVKRGKAKPGHSRCSPRPSPHSTSAIRSRLPQACPALWHYEVFIFLFVHKFRALSIATDKLSYAFSIIL